MTKRKYNEIELREAISNARSIRQALIILGVSSKGGNYRVIHKAVAKYNIDISHFKGKGWSKNDKIGPKRPLVDYLKDNTTINSFRLKKRLMSEGIMKHECSFCLSSSWLNNPIPLELDHIDGNNTNNKLDNLRLLCPNCHALTDTYRGKNIKKASYT